MDSLASKSLRDDEHILALNYENLCDADYLNKLFNSGMNSEAESSESEGAKKFPAASTILMSPELPESLILFGKESKLGSTSILLRSVKDLVGSMKHFDVYSSITEKQVAVFQYIANYLLTKYSEKIVLPTCSSLFSVGKPPDSNAQASDDQSLASHLVSESVFNMLRIFDEKCSRFASLSEVEPMMSFMAKLSYETLNSSKSRLEERHTRLMCSILSKIVCKAFDQYLSLPSDMPLNASLLKLALKSSYTMLTLGIQSKDFTFLLATIVNLMTTNIFIASLADEGNRLQQILEEKKETTGNVQQLLHTEKLSVKTKLLIGKGGLDRLENSSPDLDWSDIDRGTNFPNGKSMMKSRDKSSGPNKLDTQKDPINIKSKKKGIFSNQDADGTNDPFRGAKKVTDSLSLSDKVAMKSAGHVMLNISDPFNFHQSPSSIAQKLSTVPRSVISIIKNSFIKSQVDIDGLFKSFSACRSGKRKTQVWTCGQNSYGELAHGDVIQRRTFARVSNLDDKGIVGIGAGNEHTIFCTDDGRILVTGYNDNGQCGIGVTSQVRNPTTISTLETDFISQVHVYNGCEHSLVISKDGKLYAFGYNYRGQLGLGDVSSSMSPRLVKGLSSKRVVQAACSYHHSMVLCSDGSVYSFGRNDTGQLGHGDISDRVSPCLVQSSPKNIIGLSCGQFHSVLVTKAGSAWACGKNDYGQLGFESSESIKVLTRVSIPQDYNVTQICCGYYHTLFRTQNALVFGCGRNDYGQLGLGHSQPRMFGLHVIGGLRDKSVVTIASGCYHSVVKTSNSMLYVFGRNNHGQLGTNDQEERHYPHPVDDFVGMNIVSIAAGFYHTCLLVGENTALGDDVGRLGVCVESESNSHRIYNEIKNEIVRKPSLPRDDDYKAADIQNSDVKAKSVNMSVESTRKDSVTLMLSDLIVFLVDSLAALPAMTISEFSNRDNLLQFSVHLKSISLLLEICRRFLCSNLNFQLLFSQEEMLHFTSKLILVSENFLSKNSQFIKKAIRSDISPEFEDLNSILADPPCRIESLCDMLRELHFLTDIRDSKMDDKAHEKYFFDSLIGLKKELICSYFFLSTEEDDEEHLVSEIAVCMTTCFSVLYCKPSNASNFLSALSDRIEQFCESQSSASTSSKQNDYLDYLKSLKLFSFVCHRIGNMSDVIMCIQESFDDSLQIFERIVSVSNFLSKLIVNNDLQVFSRIEVGEIYQALALIESSCVNFTKCIVPIMFSSKFLTETSGQSIQNIFNFSEELIDMLSSQVSFDASDNPQKQTQNGFISNEILSNSLRYCIILSSILPSVLLNAIVFTSQDGPVRHLLPSILKLHEKCKGFERLLTENQQKVKGMSNGYEGDQALDLSVDLHRKDYLPAWWSQILRLGTVLCVTTAAKLTQHNVVDDSCRKLFEHELWAFVVGTGSHDICNFSNTAISSRQYSVGSEVCSKFRHYALANDASYRTFWQGIKMSGNHQILESIERALFDTMLTLEGYPINHISESNFSALFRWLNVVSFSKFIQSQRSAFLEKYDGISWKTLLVVFHRLIVSIRDLLLNSCRFKCRLTRLPLKKGLHLSLKRVLLVVLCSVRISAYCRNKSRRFSKSLVNFVEMSSNYFFNKVNVCESGVFQSTWIDLVKAINLGNIYSENFNVGITLTYDLLMSAPSMSIKCDLIRYFMSNWAETSLQSIQHQIPNLVGKSMCTSIFSNINIAAKNEEICKILLNFLLTTFKDFSTDLSKSTALNGTNYDLVYHVLVSKFLFMICVFSPHFVGLLNISELVLNLKHLFISLENSCLELQSSEEKGNSKRGNLRERIDAIRSAESILISVIQSLSLLSVSSAGLDYKADEILLSQACVLEYLQKARVIASEALDSSQRMLNMKPEGKDLSSGTKDSAAIHKKRCQDIITTPRVFSKEIDGLVIQGEKLLSNYKGIDFTLSFWIFVSKKSTSKYSFITGKVSHNDAWPLVTLRNDDLKLDIFFGRGNDFERFTSNSVVSLKAWTHIAVVVEPRKIKLFVNGIQDAKVSSPGNARAVLYPVIVGSCPQSVRSRIDNIRDGVDGIIAQYKYYTRALSPIHARVIYDLGPPESYDAKERWMFQLLSCSKILIDTGRTSFPSVNLQKICDVLLSVVLFDGDRLSTGAAILLQKLLHLDVLDDLSISRSTILHDEKHYTIPQQQQQYVFQTTVMKASFLDVFENFRERFLFFFIKLIGLYWGLKMIPSIVNEIDMKTKELLKVIPSRFLESNDTSSSSESPVSEVEPRIDEIVISISQEYVQFIRSVIQGHPKWQEAFESILNRVLTEYQNTHFGSSDREQVFDFSKMIDVLGCSILLGNFSSKPILGEYVSTKFTDEMARVVHHDKSTGNLVIFNPASWGRNRCQIVSVRKTDILGNSMFRKKCSLSIFLSPQLLNRVHSVMKALIDASESLSSDFLSVFNGDNTFYKHYLLNSVQPLHALVLNQLMNFISASDLQPELHSESFSDLVTGFNRLALRAQTQCQHNNDMFVDVSDLWISATSSIANWMNPRPDATNSLTSCSVEILKITRSSCVDSLIQSYNLSKDAFASSCLGFLEKGYMMELIQMASGGVIPPYCLGESDQIVFRVFPDAVDCDTQPVMKLMHNLRRHIITCSRFCASKTLNTSDIPEAILIITWIGMSNMKSWKSLELNETFSCLSDRLLASFSDEMSETLSSSIRYVALSLLDNMSSQVGSTSPGIEDTDVFERLIVASLCWIRLNIGRMSEQATCRIFLKNLLPSISFIRSNEVKETLLSLCQYVVGGLLRINISGSLLSSDIVDFLNSSVVVLLRAHAQELLMKERGRFRRLYSRSTHLYVDLSSSLEIIQRLSVLYNTGDKTNSITEITPLRVVSLKKTVIEIEVVHVKDGEIVEIALAVAHDKDDCNFEIIYRGTSSRLIHSGLSAQSSYLIKYRIIKGTSKTSWSPVVEFKTEASLPFTFDPMKCGPDITIQPSGLSASYSGDDCWSTVLVTDSFCSGISRWDIKITRSSTAYIFVGVAFSAADLNTFLGGCQNGWGFIGEQALYHNREKTKMYGEAFVSGDTVGVIVDQNVGTITFTKNGKSLGLAFENVYGELYPAVAFYSNGQEVQIIPESVVASHTHEVIPISPSRINLDDVCILKELLYTLAYQGTFSSILLNYLLKSGSSWCSGNQLRRSTVSGKQIYLNSKSSALSNFGFVAGERIRTPYGIAKVVGTSHGKFWFEMMNQAEGLWFFSTHQIVAGREKGLFKSCSYAKSDSTSPKASKNTVNVDMTLLIDSFEPHRWTERMDNVLVQYLQQMANKKGQSCWSVTADEIVSEYRNLQQQLSKIVMGNPELSHRWGIAGPKRRAVVARICLLRTLNHLLQQTLPCFLSSYCGDNKYQKCDHYTYDNFSPATFSLCQTENVEVKTITVSAPHELSKINFSWNTNQIDSGDLVENLVTRLRRRVFLEVKLKHFWEIVSSSTFRASKTDDDYDYPEDLPQVKINRLKSFRAREAAELSGVSGEDLKFSSMFCQLWRELRQHPEERLRLSYTHPMDDGQSRAFKVRFEGEGVDDYGGPYREIFQHLCDELQAADPSVMGKHVERPSSWDTTTFSTSVTTPIKCFLPLLQPSNNWTAGESSERYKYIFLSSECSVLKKDLYKFLGQLVGIAVRSKITLDLAFPSIIWKFVTKERLYDTDLASFDVSASQFIQHLSFLYRSLLSKRAAISSRNTTDSSVGEWGAEDAASAEGSTGETITAIEEEIQSIIQDLNWTSNTCDGKTILLVPDGASKPVTLESVGKYLELYVESRLYEFFPAVDAFRRGVWSVLPESSLSLFTWEELEHLVCGSRNIDIERLKSNTEYDDDISANDPHVVAFWEVLRSFSEADKSAFLRFVWARPTLPPVGVEFPQKMKIQTAVGDDANQKPDSYLPKAHTCFFSLNLPNYSSKEILKAKLLYAISQCTEMDADFRVTETDVVGWSAGAPSQPWPTVNS